MNISYQNIMHLLDLTCLKDQVSLQDIQQLEDQAKRNQVAAVCLWPHDLDKLSENFQIPKATVVNFPDGQDSCLLVQQQIDHILKKHPHTEIDYVFPYQQYWAGEEKAALQHCKNISQHCQQHQVKCKVILETGYLDDGSKLQKLATQVIEQQVSMLKTSTGKIRVGATPTAVTALCLAIKQSSSLCGIKVSGGIKTYSSALSYLQLIQRIIPKKPDASWLRLGCSQLIDDSSC